MSLGTAARTLGLVVGGVALLVLAYALALRWLAPPAEPLRAENPAGLLGDIVQVEVRNGCGESGVAGTVTAYLRRRGFDVVESGNWSRFDVAETRVLDRVGNPEAAAGVARALGLPEGRIAAEPDPRYFVDATVVIGRDFAALPPFTEDPR